MGVDYSICLFDISRERVNKVKKLSELSNDLEVSYEDAGCAYTVQELKQILLDPTIDDDLLTKDWYLIERMRWNPDARGMIDDYIENESSYKYDDWEEQAQDCITDEVITKIQEILDEAFKGDSATEYWNLTERFELDVDNLHSRS